MDWSVDLRRLTFDSETEGVANVQVRGRQLGSMGGSADVELYLSTDGILDDNDIMIESRTVTFNRGGGSQRFDVDFDTSALPIANGSYTVLARVVGAGDTRAGNNEATRLANPDDSDAIDVWISTALNAVQSAGTGDKGGLPPTLGSRMMALLTTAIHDSVAAVTGEFEQFAVDVEASARANVDAAIAAAARTVLMAILPGEETIIEAQYDQFLRDLRRESGVNRRAIREGVQLGEEIANELLDLRANDGSAVDPFGANYVGRSDRGDYVYNLETNGGVALGASFGAVDRWLEGSEVFQLPGLNGFPGAYGGDQALFEQELTEARLHGGLANTSGTTLVRTADETDIALFWAYDRPDTFRPYGQLFDYALDIANQEGTDFFDKTRLFAALGTGLADTVISVWNAKYINDQPRPFDVITGVRDAGSIGANLDPDWQSLLSSINGIQSPPFPDYGSGHSGFGGAFASILTAFYGDNVTFTVASQDLRNPDGTFVTRTFGGSGNLDGVAYLNGFQEAGVEDALSRLYGGVHVREANVESYETGLQIGAFAAQQFLLA